MNMNKRTLWALAAVATAAALLATGAWRTRSASPKPAPATAKAAVLELAATDVLTLGMRDLPLSVPVSGTLRASQSAWVKARVSGELLHLKVREGDPVTAGQVLAQTDPTEAQARWRQAQQQADAARAQAEIAQNLFDNNAALAKQGFISATALQTSALNLSAARATQQSAQAAADGAQKALQDTTLKAPFSGWVAQRLAQPGERLMPDARVLEVVNLGQLELEAALPAPDAAAVRVGMKAQLHIEGLAQPVTAAVLRINPSAQAGSRSVLVYLGVNGQTGLRHGAFAQGALVVGQANTLALPQSSVRIDKPQPYVQVVQAGVVRHAPVTLGARSEMGGAVWVAVAGLQTGTQVLAGSAGAVREGVAVQTATATGNAAPAAPSASAAAPASPARP